MISLSSGPGRPPSSRTVKLSCSTPLLHVFPGSGMWECIDFYPVSNGLDASANGQHVLKASLDQYMQDYYGIGSYDSVDHSIVESFAQEGRSVITSQVYPTKAIDGAAKLFLFNNATGGGASVTASVKVTAVNGKFSGPTINVTTNFNVLVNVKKQIE